MIELVLVRHAKSDWGEPGLADHDRPLNDRGLRDAPAMAARFAEETFRLAPLAQRTEDSNHRSLSEAEPRRNAPAMRILSSTALRARTTAAAFGAALGVEVELRAELYGASARTLLATAAASGASSVMLVAHDPGMSDLAEELSGGGIEHMPTCAVAHFTWNTDDWDVAESIPPTTWDQQTPR